MGSSPEVCPAAAPRTERPALYRAPPQLVGEPRISSPAYGTSVPVQSLRVRPSPCAEGGRRAQGGRPRVPSGDPRLSSGAERREVWSAYVVVSPDWRRYLLSNTVDRRADLLVSALRLSFLTIGWNGLVGGTALVVSFLDDSLALAAFALNALLDSFASAVLIWRFRKEQRDPVAAEHFERKAQTWIILAMLMVALYIGVQAIRALAGGSHPEASAFGLILAVLSLIVLPWLGRRKLAVASDLRSPALGGDGVLTLAAAALAAITLTALLLNSALNWWWADPLAALLIAAGLATEAMRISVRHRFG